MSTLLLRLEGPMQSWGIDSRFRIRETLREPTKSGVIGLICAALGKPRMERADDGFPSLKSLASLLMGIRVDREGTLERDYHTAGGGRWLGGGRYGVVRASGQPGGTVLSERFYLADASFVVGLEGSDESLLRELDGALGAPHWPLFLGRKAFPPAVSVRWARGAPGASVVPFPLLDALTRAAWPHDLAEARAVIETDMTADGTSSRQDVPLDFSTRRFGLRHVQRLSIRPGDRQ